MVTRRSALFALVVVLAVGQLVATWFAWRADAALGEWFLAASAIAWLMLIVAARNLSRLPRGAKPRDLAALREALADEKVAREMWARRAHAEAARADRLAQANERLRRRIAASAARPDQPARVAPADAAEAAAGWVQARKAYVGQPGS